MKKTKSTFERVMSDPKQKKAFEKEYANFLLSELLLDAMAQQDISVRALSKASGISTSVIQNLRAMQPVNITLKTLNALLSSLGYELVARKGRHCVNLSAPLKSYPENFARYSLASRLTTMSPSRRRSLSSTAEPSGSKTTTFLKRSR